MRFILIFLFILLASLSGTSNNLDFTTADMLTYRYYQEKKWDSVIIIGKQALMEHLYTDARVPGNHLHDHLTARLYRKQGAFLAVLIASK